MNEEVSKHLSVFGDESINNNIVCYGVVGIPTRLVEKAESVLKDIKKEFGVPEDYFLHCRELFHHHPRSKLSFEIDQETVERLYLAVAQEFKSAEKLCTYVDTVGLHRKQVVIMPETGNETELYWGNKELGHMCKNACMIDVVRQRKPDEYTFYPDPDESSRMQWAGKKKAKVGNPSYNMIIPENLLNYDKANKTEFTRLNHVAGNSVKPALIQLADLLAYSFAKAKTIQEYPSKPYFVNIINIMNPTSRRFNMENKPVSEWKSR